MANLTFQKLANEAERKYPTKTIASFCYFGKSKFPKPCQIGKKLTKKSAVRNDPKWALQALALQERNEESKQEKGRKKRKKGSLWLT